MKNHLVKGINGILERNDIPWKFDDQDYPEGWREQDDEDYPEGNGYGKVLGPFDRKVCIRGGSGYNCFPSDVDGSLHDDFLGYCGLGSGNNSLRSTFDAMACWAQKHAKNGDRQRLTAVILTDKWNAAQYEKQCECFKVLNIHLVVILCVSNASVELPYVYTDLATCEFIKIHRFNEEQAEVIKHVVRYVRGNSGKPLGNIKDISDDVIRNMMLETFGSESNEVLWDLRAVLKL